MLKLILPYAKQYRKQFILGPIFKLCEAIFELLLPLYLAKLIDQGIIAHHSQSIIKNTIIIVIFSIIGLLCVLICQYFASIASQGFGTNLRNACFEKIQHLSQKQREQFGTHSLLTRLTSDINQLQQAAAMLIRLVIRAPFLSIGSIIMAFYMNMKLAWIFVAILPIFSTLLAYIMIRTVPLFKKVQNAIDKLTLSMTEILQGVRVIRAFNQQKQMAKRAKTISQQLASRYKKAGHISSLLNPGTTLIVNIGIVTLLIFGAISIHNKQLQVGELIALINYMTQMLLALIVVANLVVTFTKAIASGKRVAELLQQPTENSVAEKQLKQWKTISFQKVSYRYSDDSDDAIHNISFDIKHGMTIGIIGPTGSGKTTLVQLLDQSIQPTEGHIKIDHIDCQQYNRYSIQRQLGVVPQKAVLLKGTIRSNLKFANPNASDDDCWEALKKAQIFDFVQQLPSQLDTHVERFGRNFSGGQRQRLTIARAFIRKPQLLILDDSLSALDYQTDLKLRKELKKYNQTTLIVSQRIASIQSADYIIAMDNGIIKGSGTHDELLHHCPLYKELYQSQEGGQEDVFNTNC